MRMRSTHTREKWGFSRAGCNRAPMSVRFNYCLPLFSNHRLVRPQLETVAPKRRARRVLKKSRFFVGALFFTTRIRLTAMPHFSIFQRHHAYPMLAPFLKVEGSTLFPEEWCSREGHEIPSSLAASWCAKRQAAALFCGRTSRSLQ